MSNQVDNVQENLCNDDTDFTSLQKCGKSVPILFIRRVQTSDLAMKPWQNHLLLLKRCLKLQWAAYGKEAQIAFACLVVMTDVDTVLYVQCIGQALRKDWPCSADIKARWVCVYSFPLRCAWYQHYELDHHNLSMSTVRAWCAGDNSQSIHV